MLSVGSRRESGNEFQTIGAATENDRRPNLLRRCRYYSVSILDFIGAKDDGGGGDNWSFKTWKSAVKSSKP